MESPVPQGIVHRLREIKELNKAINDEGQPVGSHTSNNNYYYLYIKY